MAKFYHNGERITEQKFETKMRYTWGMLHGYEFDEVTNIIAQCVNPDGEEARDNYLPDGVEITF